MSLTLGRGPLSAEPAATNYRVDGPAHRLLFEAFERRVRAELAGVTVLDTRRGRLLHETGLLPQLYVPRDDLRSDLLEPSDRVTHCPYKGEARYWSIRAGGGLAEDAVWAYPAPTADARWLEGFAACRWGSMDRWLDEDEEVAGHLRDPYHRVDVRASSRRVRVLAHGEVVADSRRPMLLSETGLPNRYYLPPDDVRRELLEPSATETVCPYKGVASYRTLTVQDRRIEDAAWLYAEPLEAALKARGYLCFLGGEITLEIDGEALAQ